MSRYIVLRLSKKEAECLVEDCLELKEGGEIYTGYEDDKYLRDIYKSIHNKLILCLYGKELYERKEVIEK